MKMPLMLLLLVAILMQVVTAFPFERSGAGGTAREKYASWDDVNVVAHGLLQLGHGLKDHVDKYKGQMRDVTGQLKALNSTVTELAKKSQAKGGDAPGTEAQDTEGRDGSAEVRARERAEQQISARMERLEEKVDEALRRRGLDDHSDNNVSHHGDVSFAQILELQTKRIDELVEKIRQQQDKLEKQTVHLQALQSKVSQKKGKSFVRHSGVETPLEGSSKHGNAPTDMALDCQELFLKGERDSGVYAIQPHNSQPFHVLCEMTSDGGWTVIQKRQDGSQSFNQLWEAYQKGFGSLTGEFWMGLENIHSLSQQGQKTLMVELTDWKGEVQSVQYQFRLDGEEKNYALHLQQGPTGALETALHTPASGLPFSTPDRDNDQRSDINCAKNLSGGWWFSDCGSANLNGRYPRKALQMQQPRKQLAFWSAMTARHNLLKITMKIKS